MSSILLLWSMPERISNCLARRPCRATLRIPRSELRIPPRHGAGVRGASSIRTDPETSATFPCLMMTPLSSLYRSRLSRFFSHSITFISDFSICTHKPHRYNISGGLPASTGRRNQGRRSCSAHREDQKLLRPPSECRPPFRGLSYSTIPSTFTFALSIASCISSASARRFPRLSYQSS